MKVSLELAYLLHRRPYRETSFLLEVFTKEYGRLSLVAKGARKKSSQAGLLQPFQLLFLSWIGKNELMTLTQVEPASLLKSLKETNLFAGFYLNELLIRLLQKGDPYPLLFDKYHECLTYLQSSSSIEKYLRVFEMRLLEEIGYGLMPKTMHGLRHDFVVEKCYQFIPEQGFFECGKNAAKIVFSGKQLLAIANENWDDKTVLQDAKQLLRFVLAQLIGNRPLYSRKLFVNPNRE